MRGNRKSAEQLANAVWGFNGDVFFHKILSLYLFEYNDKKQ